MRHASNNLYAMPLLALVGCATTPAPAASARTAEPPPAPLPARGPVAKSTGGVPLEQIDVHVETHPSQGEQRTIAGAHASLTASGEGLGVRVTTRELTPGHVHTLWVVAINDPGACASSPCTPQDVLGNSDAVKSDVTWGGSAIADDAGEVELSAFIPAGEWKGSWFGRGYTAGLDAEIHIVLNDHGPAVPGLLADMMRTTRGGCTDESVPPPFPASARNDGRPGPNACALVQDAIFIQGR